MLNIHTKHAKAIMSTHLKGFNKTVINIRAITIMRKILNLSIYSSHRQIIDNTINNIASATDCNTNEKAYYSTQFNIARLFISRGMLESAYNVLLDMRELMMNEC